MFSPVGTQVAAIGAGKTAVVLHSFWRFFFFRFWSPQFLLSLVLCKERILTTVVKTCKYQCIIVLIQCVCVSVQKVDTYRRNNCHRML